MKVKIFIVFGLVSLCSCNSTTPDKKDFFAEMKSVNQYINRSANLLLPNDTVKLSDQPSNLGGKEYFLLNTKLSCSGYYRIENNNLFYLPKEASSLKEYPENIILNFSASIGDTFNIDNLGKKPNVLIKVLSKYYDKNITDSVLVLENDMLVTPQDRYYKLYKHATSNFPDSEKLFGLAVSKKWGILFFACKKEISNKIIIYYHERYLEQFKYSSK